jgi:hypothetical protein
MAAVVIVTAVMLVAGCGAGSAPQKIGPQGIDELTVPTPSADPADFRRHPKSRWLPTRAGEVAGDGQDVFTQRRLPDEEIAGVAVTPVEVSAGESGLLLRWYAVDERGNVWVFGERSSGIFGVRDWRAGAAGALPGLLVPAEPRRGDGFLREKVPGGPRDRATTLRVAGTDPSYAEQCPGCVEFEVQTRDGQVFRETYASGSGLIKLFALEVWPMVE